MRIAMFCSSLLPTPPANKEKRIHAPLHLTALLASEMAKRGHSVTLFGAKGTKSKANVVDLDLPPLFNHPQIGDSIDLKNHSAINFYEQVFISEIYRRAAEGEFDIIHIHPVDLSINFAVNCRVPTVFTLHDPISPWRRFIYNTHKMNKNIFYVSISDSQRLPLKDINFIDTIYNGIDLCRYPFNALPGSYLLSASRLVPEKGVDVAIRAAKRTGLPLKITGEPASDNNSYWMEKIKPDVGGKISYEGMVSTRRMFSIYKNAAALLFPIKWEEPFGLTMIEAMACGTPVIAFNRGSVKEIVVDGRTGFIVDDLNGMIRSIKKINSIDRMECRRHVEENFSMKKMVDKYEKVYEKILFKSQIPRSR
ncbi:MAG TPA: glycosyltransferase family 4 protein [Candidatus Methanoperedens sp.]|nr:glycosyltransferase family 4 protein [Candidatus Methanoperedens sp.]